MSTHALLPDLRQWRAAACLAPALAVVAVGVIVPIFILFSYSIIDNTASSTVELTLAHYAEIVHDDMYAQILIRSLKIAFYCTVAAVLLAYPVCYYVALYVRRNMLFWIVVLTLPFWTSYLLRVFSWKIILGYNGVINSGLIWLGVVDTPIDALLYNQTAVIITLAHAWAPFAILPILASLSKLDRSVLEVSEDLGDSPLRRFLRVTLPLSAPGIIVASLLVFIPTVGDYVTPALVGGSSGAMIGNLIKTMFGPANDWPVGSALAMACMAAVVIVAVGVVKALGGLYGRGQARTVAGGTPSGDPPRGLRLYCVVYLVLLYIPIVLIPIFSFNNSIYATFPLQGFTFDWYIALFEAEGLLDAFRNSVTVGLIVSLVSTVLGALAANALTRYRLVQGGRITAFIVSPLAIPFVVIGTSVLGLVNALDINLSLFTIGFGHVLLCLPFATMVMISRLEGFDRNLEDASHDLGRGRLSTLYHVTLPLNWPGVVASLLLTFIISFDEFVVTFFLAGTEATLPLYIWSELRFSQNLPIVLALGTLIVFVSAALFVVAEQLRNRTVARA